MALYTVDVKVKITQFRRDLFTLAEKALEGQRVEFVHRGRTIRLVPDARSKLDRLTPLQITNPKMTAREHRAAQRKLRAEMLAEMEKDWSEI